MLLYFIDLGFAWLCIISDHNHMPKMNWFCEN